MKVIIDALSELLVADGCLDPALHNCSDFVKQCVSQMLWWVETEDLDLFGEVSKLYGQAAYDKILKDASDFIELDDFAFTFEAAAMLWPYRSYAQAGTMTMYMQARAKLLDQQEKAARATLAMVAVGDTPTRGEMLAATGVPTGDVVSFETNAAAIVPVPEFAAQAPATVRAKGRGRPKAVKGKRADAVAAGVQKRRRKAGKAVSAAAAQSEGSDW